MAEPPKPDIDTSTPAGRAAAKLERERLAHAAALAKLEQQRIVQENLKLRIEARSIDQTRDRVKLESIFSKQYRNYALANMAPFGLAQFATRAEAMFDKAKADRATALGYGTTPLELIRGREKELTEGLGGFEAQMGAVMVGLQAGFENMPASMRDLTASMNLTNQDSRKLVSTLKQGQVLGGLTNDELDYLSVSLEHSSRTYGTKTETLVNALDGLKKEYLKTNLMGNTKAFTAAIAQFTAKFGEGSEEIVQGLISNLMSSESLGQQVILGIEDQVSQFLRSNDPEEQVRLLEEIVRTGAASQKSLFKGFEKGAGLAQLSYGAIDGLTGDFGLLLNAVENADKKAEKAADTQHTADESMEAIMGKIFTSIDKLAYTASENLATTAAQSLAVQQSMRAILTGMAAQQTLSILGRNISAAAASQARAVKAGSKGTMLGRFATGRAGTALGTLGKFAGLAGIGLAGADMLYTYANDQYNEEKAKEAARQRASVIEKPRVRPPDDIIRKSVSSNAVEMFDSPNQSVSQIQRDQLAFEARWRQDEMDNSKQLINELKGLRKDVKSVPLPLNPLAASRSTGVA